MELICKDKFASLDSCSHSFCFDCIQDWAVKCSNTCPNCKERFNEITTATKTVPIKTKTTKFSNFVCSVCHDEVYEYQEEDLEICDICFESVAHAHCINMI